MRQAERIRYLLLAAQREGNRQLAAALSPLAVTPAQSEVLRILGDHDTLTLGGVGQMLVCDSGTNPSRLIERLVQAGLVERRTDSTDRRQLNLTLTPAGRALEREVRRIEDALYDSIDTLPGGAELASALELLVAGQPAGEALQRRIDGDGSQHKRY